ncbi:hypothetical protein K1T71_003791 [Dendrolimus kikuchii]|uniref:Uncharacterized protein n=1 Tax=Dendrolimus kikuchii TaxID=765133 RepID=A0ACC1D9Y7_9NEOP|nr:hypothetical protein K1T71_003791 [Dendrolimus kikuchii]
MYGTKYLTNKNYFLHNYNHSGVWSSYADRLQMYFKVNGIKDELKLPTMIAVMGDEVYELLVNLASPRKPSELDYSEATELLRNHLQPSPSVLAERFRFRQRRQNSDENVNNYVAELKRLARTCNFKDSLNENLRDQFVCGLQNDIFRQRLFAEDESLTFIKAVQVAISLEAAERDAAAVEVRSVPGTSQSVELHAVREGRSGRARQQRGSSAGWSTTRWTGRSSKPEPDHGNCKGCGSTNHSYGNCRFRDFVCSRCRRPGHLRRVCPETRDMNSRKTVERRAYIFYVHQLLHHYTNMKHLQPLKCRHHFDIGDRF